MNAIQGIIFKGYKLNITTTDISYNNTIDITDAQTFTKHITGLLNNITYRISISACASVDVASAAIIDTIYGELYSVHVTPKPPPNEPTDFTATTTADKITLQWFGPVTGVIDGYKIYMDNAELDTIDQNSSGLPFTADVTGLTNGQIYNFKLYTYVTTAEQQVLKSTNFQSLTAKFAIAPAIISSVSYTSNDLNVGLFWSAPTNTGDSLHTNNGPILYKISYYNGSQNIIYDNIDKLHTSSNPYFINGLTNRTRYPVQVFAYFLAGGNTLTQSPPYIIDVYSSAAPRPLIFTATPSNKKVVLNWDYSVYTNPNYYLTIGVEIYRNNVSAPIYSQRNVNMTQYTSYTDTNLDNGTSYSYTMKRVLRSTDNILLPYQINDNIMVASVPVSAIPFGQPIVDTITGTQILGGYSGYSATINNNGSPLNGCLVLAYNNAPDKNIIVFSPLLTDLSNNIVSITGFFTPYEISSFAIVPFNNGGSAFVGFPEQSNGFGAPLPLTS
jgi:hypothetical protein